VYFSTCVYKLRKHFFTKKDKEKEKKKHTETKQIKNDDFDIVGYYNAMLIQGIMSAFMKAAYNA